MKECAIIVYNCKFTRWLSTVLPRIGLSKKESTELKVSKSLPMVKQEKTEEEVGMSIIIIVIHTS